MLTKRSCTFKRKSPQPRRLWGRDWKVKLSRNAGFQACEKGRAEGGLCQVQTGRKADCWPPGSSGQSPYKAFLLFYVLLMCACARENSFECCHAGSFVESVLSFYLFAGASG